MKRIKVDPEEFSIYLATYKQVWEDGIDTDNENSPNYTLDSWVNRHWYDKGNIIATYNEDGYFIESVGITTKHIVKSE